MPTQAKVQCPVSCVSCRRRVTYSTMEAYVALKEGQGAPEMVLNGIG